MRSASITVASSFSGCVTCCRHINGANGFEHLWLLQWATWTPPEHWTLSLHDVYPISDVQNESTDNLGFRHEQHTHSNGILIIWVFTLLQVHKRFQWNTFNFGHEQDTQTPDLPPGRLFQLAVAQKTSSPGRCWYSTVSLCVKWMRLLSLRLLFSRYGSGKSLADFSYVLRLEVVSEGNDLQERV